MFAASRGGPCVASLTEAAGARCTARRVHAGAPRCRAVQRVDSGARPPLRGVRELSMSRRPTATGAWRSSCDSDNRPTASANVQKLRQRDRSRWCPWSRALARRPSRWPRRSAREGRCGLQPRVLRVYGRRHQGGEGRGIRRRSWAVNSGAAQMAHCSARGQGPDLHPGRAVPCRGRASVKEYQQALARRTPRGRAVVLRTEGYLSAKVLVAGLRAAGRDPRVSACRRRWRVGVR